MNGVATDLPTGYPDVSTRGANQVFTFRLPRGAKILYDPIIDGAGVDSSSAAGLPSLAAAVAAVLVALVM